MKPAERWNATRPRALTYGFAVLCVGLALAGSILFTAHGYQFPFSPFLAAVTLSVWYGGLGPGLAATVLSAATAVVLISPAGPPSLQVHDELDIAVFMAVAVLVARLSESWRQAQVQARAEALRATRLAETEAQAHAEMERLNAELEQRVQARTAELAITLTDLRRANEFLAREIWAHREAEARLAESNEQLRSLAQRLQAAREEERGRIARELHDELGGALTGLKMDLSWVQRAPAGQDPEAADRLAHIAREIDRTIGTVRRLATELRPAILDDLGLRAAIEWQLQEFECRSGIRCRLISDPEQIALDSACGAAVFRVLQESLTNVARHAQATEVTVSLSVDASELELRVRDNGQGFVPAEASHKGSLGLAGMRERVAAFAGRLELESAPGQGSAVIAHIPLEQPAA